MNTLTDDKLIKRATHAGRNLSVLAILASFGAVGLMVVAVLAKNTAFIMTAVPALTFVIIATGYWLLAVAAKRGNPSSVGAVIVVMVIQLTLTLVSYGIAAAKTGANAQPNTIGWVIPVLVIVALVSSRNVLLELRKRGLWDQVFSAAKPSARFCVTGSILVVAGFLALNVSSVYAGWRVGQERQQETQCAQIFVNMIQTEESAFMESMKPLYGEYSAEDLQTALVRVTELELKAKAIDAAGPLGSIVGTYCNAVRQWKNAVALLNETEPDVDRAQQMLVLGDKLRAQAGQEFDRRYIKQQ